MKSLKPIIELRLLLFIPLSILLFGTTIKAIPVADYRKNIESSIGALDAVIREEQESQGVSPARLAEVLNSIKALLPLKLAIESGDEHYSADNTWLHQSLDECEKPTVAERSKLLTRVQERLKALAERILETEKGSAVGASKEDAKRKLGSILARSEFAAKPEEESALSKLLLRFIRWLMSLLRPRSSIQPSSAYRITQVAQIIVVAVAVAVIAYVLWVFAPGLRKVRGVRKQKSRARVVLGEELEPDQSSRDLLSEAEALARRGDLRAAIRKAYIALLVELSDRKVISLAQHKTNRDYLWSLREREPLYGRMINLTNSFERHWYGFSKATESDWNEFRSGYREALRD